MVKRAPAAPSHLVLVAALAAMAWAASWAALPRGVDPADRVAIERVRELQRLLAAERDRVVDAGTRAELALNDAEASGLVGVEWSPVTTTPGSLAAKRLAARPEWVRVFRAWYREAGLGAGDVVAINSSASFPGLLLAARVAAQSMDIEARVVASLTSSNYGANVPAFDLAAMDRVLVERGDLPPAIVGITAGGDGDTARDLEDAVRVVLRSRIDKLGRQSQAIATAWPASVEESIAFRRRLLLDAEPEPQLLVSIGGHIAALGVGDSALVLPPGLIRPDDEVAPRAGGLAREALDRGIPVVKVLGLRELDASLPLIEGTAQRAPAWMRVASALVGLILLAWVGSTRRAFNIAEATT